MLKKGEFSRSEKMISSPAHDEMASMASDNGIQGVVISEEQKIEDVKKMRQLVSPPDALQADGSLNYRYFSEQVHDTWIKQRDTPLLIQGIEKHGVGNWTLIKSEFLNHHPLLVLTMQAKLLLASRDLHEYHNFKLNGAQIAQIRQDNLKRAQAQGLLYNSMRYASLAQMHNAKLQCVVPQISEFPAKKVRELIRKRDKAKAKKSRATLAKECHTLDNFFKKQGQGPKQLPEIEKKKKIEKQETPETLSLTKTNSDCLA